MKISLKKFKSCSGFDEKCSILYRNGTVLFVGAYSLCRINDEYNSDSELFDANGNETEGCGIDIENVICGIKSVKHSDPVYLNPKILKKAVSGNPTFLYIDVKGTRHKFISDSYIPMLEWVTKVSPFVRFDNSNTENPSPCYSECEYGIAMFADCSGFKCDENGMEISEYIPGDCVRITYPDGETEIVDDVPIEYTKTYNLTDSLW